jgi:hypothetical protein
MSIRPEGRLMAAVLGCARVLLCLPHPGKQVLFALLSVADLALTWTLIQNGRGQFYESNPVAAWCLRWHGWTGLAAFKACMVGLTVVLVVAIARRRPRAAGRLLVVASAAAGAVIVHGGILGLGSASSLSTLQAAEERAARNVLARGRFEEFWHLQARLACDVADGRNVVEAATDLEPVALRSCTTQFLKVLRGAHEGRPLRECLAANLMGRCLDRLLDRPEEAVRQGRRLDAEVCSAFGRRPPREIRDLLARVERAAAERQAR